MTTREEELALYVEAYRDPNYRMGVRRKADVRKILEALEPNTGLLGPNTSLLDLGTGRGETLDMAVELGFWPVRGAEAVPELQTHRVHAWQADQALLWADGCFDHVTCFDVVEHLIEEDIHNLVREAYRVASMTVTISASEVPGPDGPNGRDLHISRRSAASWQRLFECLTGTRWVQIGTAGRSPCFRTIKS